MYNKKSLATIILFNCIVLFVVVTALTAENEWDDSKTNKAELGQEKSIFKGIHFFRVLNFNPSFELKSDLLEISADQSMTFEKPTGTLVGDDNSINYSANSGQFNQETMLLNLQGSVDLRDKTSDYASDNLSYDGKKKIISAYGGVAASMTDPKTFDLIKLEAKTLESNLAKKKVELNGDVKGAVIRKRRYEGKFNFKAQQVLLDSAQSLLKLDKSVKLERNNYHLTAGKAEIFLENFNKKLKYYVLYDDVKLEEKLTLSSGKKQMRRAFAEKLEGHQRTGRIVLTGAPRVEQGRDVIKGYQITLRENVELVEVDDSQSSFSIKRK